MRSLPPGTRPPLNRAGGLTLNFRLPELWEIDFCCVHASLSTANRWRHYANRCPDGKSDGVRSQGDLIRKTAQDTTCTGCSRAGSFGPEQGYGEFKILIIEKKAFFPHLNFWKCIYLFLYPLMKITRCQVHCLIQSLGKPFRCSWADFPRELYTGSGVVWPRFAVDVDLVCEGIFVDILNFFFKVFIYF